MAILIGLTLPAVSASAQTLTNLHMFRPGTDAANAQSKLIYADGTLYDTTYFGGPAFSGPLFKVDIKTGAETVLHSFTGSPDGATPYAGLTHHKGVLYGTTQTGDAADLGTIFRFDPATGPGGDRRWPVPERSADDL